MTQFSFRIDTSINAYLSTNYILFKLNFLLWDHCRFWGNYRFTAAVRNNLKRSCVLVPSFHQETSYKNKGFGTDRHKNISINTRIVCGAPSATHTSLSSTSAPQSILYPGVLHLRMLCKRSYTIWNLWQFSFSLFSVIFWKAFQVIECIIN